MSQLELETLQPFMAVCSFVLGLAFGSFLNVCIFRLPLGKSVVRPGSACPKCKREIRWYDNVPVLSWLLLRAKCRDCGLQISWRYPAVELLIGLLWLGIALHFGPTLATLKYCTLAFLLVGLILTDYDHKLLPDKLTLTGFWIGLGFSLFVEVNDLLAHFYPNALAEYPEFGWRLISLGDALLGAAIGAGFIYGIGEIYFRVRGIEGMGFGDVKLMAMIGAFFGLKLTLFTLFAASMAGAVFGVSTIFVVWVKRVRRRLRMNHEPFGVARRRAWRSANMVLQHYQMPFGVFLGGMALLAVFAGSAFVRWYLGSFS